MVSVADNTYHSLARHLGSGEEADFPLYPDPAHNLFLQQHFLNAQPFDIDNHIYNFARAQAHAPYAAASGFPSTTLYADADPSAASYALESPELRAGASSNYSTASGPSATSSAMGSPSIQGHAASVPEWAPSGLGPQPGIVRYDSFGHHGNEYNFPPSGMEEFALEFDPAKPNDFVGECETISRVACDGLPGPVSSSPKSLSLSTGFASPAMVNGLTDHLRSPTPSYMAPPTPPLSARSRGSRDDCLYSPSVSALPQSPVSFRHPSHAFKRPPITSSSAAGRAQDMRSSPRSGVSQASFFPASPTSPFFSQSSGSFVLPLESSCWFPRSIQRRLSAAQDGAHANGHTPDPSILHPQYSARPSPATQSSDVYQAPTYPGSPTLSHLSHLSKSPRPVKQGSQSPYLNSHYNAYPYPPPRRQSIQSFSSQDNFSSEESREKGRCTYPDCGKVFKDLKAHMLTHQNERPEK
jgi:hypothetical protein